MTYIVNILLGIKGCVPELWTDQKRKGMLKLGIRDTKDNLHY